MNCAATQMRGYGNEAAGDKWPPAQLDTHTKKMARQLVEDAKEAKKQKEFCSNSCF
jgi:hypothetical protein